jgi:DNA adenine methylase
MTETSPQDTTDTIDGSHRVECRPFLKWAGGKTQLLQHLLRRIPTDYNRYLEPFLGGGALFFALQPRTAYLADCNSELVNCFEVVRSNVEDLIRALEGYRYDKDQYYSVRALDRSDEFAKLSPVERAARFIYLNKTCFNGLYRVNSKGHFNVPFGSYDDPKILDADNLRRCSAVLSKTILKNGNFEDVVEVAQPGDFVYFDPPYAPVSETSDFTHYAKDGFDESSQEMLLVVCLQLHQKGVRWMVSNSNVPLIQELYRGFNIEPVAASRSINSRAEKRGPVMELLIRNFN